MLRYPSPGDPLLTEWAGILNSVLLQPEVEILGVVDDGTNWNIRYRAQLSAPWVQVHVQSSVAGEGGETYDAANYTSTTEVDCRDGLVQDLALTLLAGNTYTVFFIPVQKDASGTILYNGVAGDDHMVMVSQTTTTPGVSDTLFVDHIHEYTPTHGVDIDGVSLKDAGGLFENTVTINHPTGAQALVIRDAAALTANAANPYIDFQYETSTRLGLVGWAATDDDDLYLNNLTGDIVLYAADTLAATLAVGGTLTLVDGLVATTGTFSDAVTITNTTSPLLTLKYDNSNYVTLSVENDGELGIDSVGTAPGVRFYDNVSVGTNVLTGIRLAVRWLPDLDIGYACTGFSSDLSCSLTGDPGDADRRTAINAHITSDPDNGTTQSGKLHAFRGTLMLGNTGTNSDAKGYFIETSIGAGSLVTDLYGYYYEKPANSGTLTNEYGIYLEDVSAGATLAYAIKTNAGTVSFGDTVNVGDGGTTDYMEWSATGIQQAHGAACFWREERLNPVAVRLPGTNPPAEDTIDNFPFHRYDRGTEESAYFLWHVPADFCVGDASVRGHYEFVVESPPVGASENVRMGFEYKKISEGVAFSFAAGTSSGYIDEVIADGEAAWIVHHTDWGYPTTTGWAVDDIILFRFYRDATDAADTYDNAGPATNDVWVSNYHIGYLSCKLGAAT